MKRLFIFEFQKLLHSTMTYVCLGALCFVMGCLIIAEYQDVAAYKENAAYRAEVNDWQSREENVVTFATQSLNEDEWMSNFEKSQVERRIAIANYRLENNIPKDIYKNVWWFFNDNSFTMMTSFVIVLLTLLGSVCFAGEYSKNTMRQVLLLPYKRWKILVAKICAVGIWGLILYAILFVLGFLSGLILHGFDGMNSQVVLYFGNELTTMNMSAYSLLVVLLKVIDLVFYLILALFLAVYTKNTAVTSVVTGALAVLSVPVANFIGVYYPIINYLPFCNLDFRRFLDFGTVMPQIEAGWNAVVNEGISLTMAVGIVLVFAIGFLVLTFKRFQKQEM